jgi:hypothetical protein
VGLEFATLVHVVDVYIDFITYFMADTLFGEDLVSQDQITIIYSGEHFDNGVPLNALIDQLVTLEKFTRLCVSVYINKGFIDEDIPEYQILIRIEHGSLKEIVKVIYKSPWTYAILSYVVAPMLNTTYEKALDVLIPDKSKSAEVEEILKDNPQLRTYCAALLEPITKFGGELTISTSDSQAIYSQQQAEEIKSYLQTFDAEGEVEPMKEGEFVESRIGLIRKTNLDDQHANFFGFNVEGGQKGVPMSVDGQFNFNDYRDLIDKPVVVTGTYKYKGDKITHIKLEKYELVDTITQLSIETAKNAED